VRVDQESLRKGSHQCKFVNERTTPAPKIKLQLQQLQPGWIREANEFVRKQPADYKPRIYTDGSYKEFGHDIHTVFEEEAVRKAARAGIVILHDGPEWKTRPIFALHIKEGEEIGARSAYTMEYLAIAAAHRLQNDFKATAVCSDSLAVVKTIRNREHPLKQAGGNHRVFLQSIDTGIKYGKVTPQWIQSHVERRKKDRSTWSMDEWGNHIADRTAENRANIVGVHDVQVKTITAREIMCDIPQAGELYIGDARGNPTALNGVMDHIHSIRFERYIAKRDQVRQGGPKWYDNTVRLIIIKS
jgi:hypothetical protein